MDINLLCRPYDVKKVLLVVLISLSMISIITVILSFGFIKVAERQSDSTCKNFLQSVASCQDFNFFLSILDTKVLVTTGLGEGSEELADTEVLDLVNPNLKCQNLPPFPRGKYGATGALVNKDYAIVCGGNKHGDECHTIDKNQIRPLQNLTNARYSAASVAVNGSLWVFGGYGNGYLESAEIVNIHQRNSSNKGT